MFLIGNWAGAASRDAENMSGMPDTPPVQIVLKDGPVIIRSLNGAGVSAKHDLWQGILATEFFPASVDAAYYVLTLEKSAAHADEVRIVEAELVKALTLLSAAWPFSGGSFLAFETFEEVHAPRYESNATEIEAALLAQQGMRSTTTRARLPAEFLGTYESPPLAVASRLANAMEADYALEKLLEYYRRAWIEYYHRGRTARSAWFMDLYKVKDCLDSKGMYNKRAKSRLDISCDDWSFFETKLNTGDRRHADITGRSPAITRQDVERLFQLTRTWIRDHLKKKKLLP